MNFYELVNSVNNLEINNRNAVSEIANKININSDNLDQWIENIFSEKIDNFNMGKLPYLIDELYRSNEYNKFVLCCMLLEATCDKLDFITNLEQYPLFIDKFKELIPTLISVYSRVDSGIANCMSLIILKNDPQLKYFDIKQREFLTLVTKRKLIDIFNYLKNGNIDPIVFDDLAIIVDLSCYLGNNEISKIIEEIDKFELNDESNVFIMKYKIINNLYFYPEKIQKIINQKEKLSKLYRIMEELNVNNIYLKNISQDMIAMSDMINWLKHPMELGSKPDNIELLGEVIINNARYFAFKFSKKGFRIEGDLFGISGGYPINKISSKSSGHTFSNFEKVSNDWKMQTKQLVDFINSYWLKRLNQKLNESKE